MNNSTMENEAVISDKKSTYIFHPILTEDEAKKANKYIENILQEQYNRIKNIFYQLCILDCFQCKVLVTRRAYLLFQIFASIFEFCPETRPDSADKFIVRGQIYNSHSLELIKNAENIDKRNFIVFDDIIVHGRTIRNTIKKILGKGIQIDQITICCLLEKEDSICLSNEIKDRITVYEICNEEVWKKLSNDLTKIIIRFGKGYTSYIDTYTLQSHGENIPKDLYNRCMLYFNKNKNFRILEIEQLKKHNTNAFIVFPLENKGGIHKLNCVRFYEQDDNLIGIPYIFIDTIKKEDTFKYAFQLLKENNIDQVPKCFFKDDILQPKFELSTLFLKWTINIVGERLLESILSSMDFFIKDKIRRYETFYAVDNSGMMAIKSLDDSFELQTQSCNDETNFCTTLLFDSFKESYSLAIKQNSIETELRNLIQYAFVSYAYKIKEEDEIRAKNNKERCIGIRLNDAIDICLNFIREYYKETNVNKEDIECEIIRLFIENWDCGTAAYDFVPIREPNGNDYISAFMKNGEQVFRSLYEYFEDIYQYYYAYSVRTLTTDIKKLNKFGQYLIKRLSEKKRNRANLFNNHLILNSSYYADIYVVTPTHCPDDAFEIANDYLHIEH